MPAPRDPIKKEEWRNKIRKSRIGKSLSEETKLKIKKSNLGMIRPQRTEQWREKQRLVNLGRKHSIESKQKMSEKQRGARNHNFGRRLPENVRRKISIKKTGRKLSFETRRKMSEARKGIKNPAYVDGQCRRHYCYKFKAVRPRVIAFFNNRCIACGITEEENRELYNKGLAVHHVYYNPMACCDTDERAWIFVPLCNKHHGETNHNRKYWLDYYKDLIIMKYNGKSYYSDEEYNNLLNQT